MGSDSTNLKMEVILSLLNRPGPFGLIAALVCLSLAACEKSDQVPASATAPSMCAEGFKEYEGGLPEFDVLSEDVVFMMSRFFEESFWVYFLAFEEGELFNHCDPGGSCKFLTAQREHFIDRCERIEVVLYRDDQERLLYEIFSNPLKALIYDLRASHESALNAAEYLDGRVEARCPIDLYYSPQPDVWCQKRVRLKDSSASGE